jgi:hypothetical protein
MRPIPPLALAALLALSAPVAALGPVAFGPDLAANGWDEITFRGRTPAEFSADGASGLRVETESGVSVLWRALPPAFGPATTAGWRWRVDAGVAATDLGSRGGDDRSLALYFVFADDPGSVRETPRTLRAAMRRGRALIYVWGGDAPRGSVIASPSMLGRGQMLIARTDPTGGWQSETVDLAGDFRRVFGREPGPLMGIGVSADSDDTAGRTDARIEGLTLR